jgi:hypothetical protein
MKISFEVTEGEMEVALEILSRLITPGLAPEPQAAAYVPPPHTAPHTAPAPSNGVPDEVGQGEVQEALSMSDRSLVGKNVHYPSAIPDFVGGPGWALFTDLILSWISNFDQEGPQPNRYELLKDLSNNPDHGKAMVCVSHCGSLQVAVKKALEAADIESCSLDFVEHVAGNIVQISHATLPELALYYDISSKWRRTE